MAETLDYEADSQDWTPGPVKQADTVLNRTNGELGPGDGVGRPASSSEQRSEKPTALTARDAT